jgi:prolyl 4-hydroxylase
MDEYYLIGIGIIVILISIVSIYFIVEYFVKFNINKIYEYPNMLSDEQCSEIISLAKPLIRPSTVIGEGGENVPDKVFRTSHNTFITRDHKVVQDIYDKLSKIIGIDSDHFEQLQVVRYEPGQQYKAHWDACWEDHKCGKFMKQGGQRYATFLLYLNDDFTGGETSFPYRNIKVKPQKGKTALFFNLEKDNKTKLEKSYHAGLPPDTGVKWLCNVWVRLNKIPEKYQ